MRLYPATAYDFLRPVESHWETTAPPLAQPLAPLRNAVSVDAAIIGAGYTGLHAAHRLASTMVMHVVVLEAATPGWGASGRNAGFCCIGGAKLSYGTMLRRYGEVATREFFGAQLDAVSYVADFIGNHAIDAERSGKGEFQLAHRRWAMRTHFGAERDLLAAVFGFAPSSSSAPSSPSAASAVPNSMADCGARWASGCIRCAICAAWQGWRSRPERSFIPIRR